jgi:hypothetical protein
MHLYGNTLERYVARDLPQEQLVVLDSHVSNCMFCAHGLADQAVVSTAWERRGWLGRLVRVEPASWVDDTVEELDAKAA